MISDNKNVNTGLSNNHVKNNNEINTCININNENCKVNNISSSNCGGSTTTSDTTLTTVVPVANISITKNMNSILNSSLSLPIPIPILSATLDDINKYYRPELSSQTLSSIPSIEVC
jgi:hypothetical protein